MLGRPLNRNHMGRDISLPGGGDSSSSDKAEARFQAVLRDYGRFLHVTVVRLCPRGFGIQVDDVEQDARLRLWRAVASEREITDPASYLYRIAHAASIDALRRVKARREEPLPDDAEEPVSGGSSAAVLAAASHEAMAEREETLARARVVIGKLAENRRRALGLHLRGFGSAEIARLLGWSEAKSRNLVYRALKELRERLKAEGVEYEGD
jgi:RNA polymerase sigma-70 factor (ECF subfamily)